MSVAMSVAMGGSAGAVTGAGAAAELSGSPGTAARAEARQERDTAIVYGSRDSSADSPGLAALADPKRSFIVADERTIAFLPDAFASCPRAIVPRGEAAKDLATLERLYEAFLEAGLGRDGRVIALGGGSVSDLTGFAASTWMRGVDFGFVPTTLLAMVDAAQGGKNGLDFGGRKNLIGSFHKPRFVLVDTACLASLPPCDLACGMAEALKHGVIEGEEHFSLIERRALAGKPLDAEGLEAIVKASIGFKGRIVAADPYEKGQRMLLNLGHSVGHGVEAVSGLAHGAAVSVGLLAAFGLAARRASAGGDDASAMAIEKAGERVRSVLQALGLPLTMEDARQAAAENSSGGAALKAADGAALAGQAALSPDRRSVLGPAAFREAVARAITADKKRRGADILFAMPKGIGTVIIEPVGLEELTAYVREAP
jgi:3-dehydroquinate synthase